MNYQFKEDKKRLWSVHFNDGVKDTRYQTMHWNVIAETMSEAMDKVKILYPCVKFINVTHKGAIDIM